MSIIHCADLFTCRFASSSRDDAAGAIIDSQTVKTSESGGPRDYDAGKKIKGRKRQALVDTDGRARSCSFRIQPVFRIVTRINGAPPPRNLPAARPHHRPH